MNKVAKVQPGDDSVKQDALSALQAKLYVGEEIRFTGLPNSALYLIDLTYKGLMWWGMFVFIVPFVPGSASIELTAMLVLMLTWLEFKKVWNKRVYFITDTRAIYAQKNRKGEWLFTDFPSSDLISVKRSPVVKNLIMKFKTIHGTKTLRFPYLADAQQALACLQNKAEEKVGPSV